MLGRPAPSSFAALLLMAGPLAAGEADPLRLESRFYSIEASREAPAIASLAVDSLGGGRRRPSPVRPQRGGGGAYEVRMSGARIEYRRNGAPAGSPPAWTFELAERRLSLRSEWSAGGGRDDLVVDFDPRVCHATLLGRSEDDGSIRLPALLHLPDSGTFRIEACEGAAGVPLGYETKRFGDDFVKVRFPAATADRRRIEYRLEVVAIHPDVPGIAGDHRFDGFRRNWLNIFQINPRFRALANHAASDPCAFTLFEYAEVALRTPPLAEGLTALDLIRETLDRYAGGMLAYGMAAYRSPDVPGDPGAGPHDFLDTYPSLVLSACCSSQGPGGAAWLERSYPKVREWAARMLAFDRDGNGLLEYPASGNAGSWRQGDPQRPSNWWDTIGFGHEDAYSNAIAWRALIGLRDLAARMGRPEDERTWTAAAEKLRAAYLGAFFDPATGILAGWRSADGKLHDYWFTFVNGVAIECGLVPEDRSGAILDRILAKMEEVGYRKFEYGLPGNLVPIRREDYVHLEKRWGGPEREDGSDAFGIYENGGATACFAYFTIAALYRTGRREAADRILFPMLRAFEEGGFGGFGPDGKTCDWKAWDGTPHGYEGFLVDGYLTLLAVLRRAER